MSNERKTKNWVDPMPLRFLNETQISLIDEVLSSVGDYGEVHLVIEKGILRFVVKQDSIDALKFQPRKK